jgi:hypothetical protein
MIHRAVRSITLSAALSVLASVAYGQTYLTNMSAFYQHQKGTTTKYWTANPATQVRGAYPGPDDPKPANVPSYAKAGDADYKKWWEPGGGWCAVTAWVNDLYYVDGRGNPNIFVHAADVGKSTMQRYDYANEDLEETAGACPAPSGVSTYLGKYGYAGRFEINTYTYDGVAGRVRKTFLDGSSVLTTYTTLRDVAYDSMISKTAPVIKIVDPAGDGSTANTWWIDFHMLTGAGYGNRTLGELWFADPDLGKNGGAPDNGLGWGSPFADADSPVGAAFFRNGRISGAGNPVFTTGPYTNEVVDRIFTIEVTPEPSGFAGLAAGTLLLAGFLRRSRCGR